MQKPVEQFYPRRFSSVLSAFPPLNKGAIDCRENIRSHQSLISDNNLPIKKNTVCLKNSLKGKRKVGT
jgi:hypothetical protein